ncbi:MULTISPECIES: winged helix-turn-helix transcriptional regulator [Myxococcus]|uniref:HxlR family transcriptional regulator n=1 Tax=Myxococcus xanthus TaxID=34 RepID=A0AAE6KUL7_MYXXA|nr:MULTISPECIES: helix-turn-helix domain-containing protein [Myxococcus]QDE70386.1 HxlR family transcriptional regulator [Myxococcus xanthus]QDE77665.1 HxlR family transcriptional regulator [Myxococcus xanthus]QDE85052.1 HxlR family transcriptional regulator [Myxococcus xanthus]QDE99207.1 HxlR family transcriptional regulator [Myxococcus xanthus]QDF06900.1 HxlR family transcriptional regulator [Myxococcus xanthus]
MARHKTYDCSAGCPVEATLDLIGGKWKGLILYHLLDGTLRFGELRKRIPGVTARMLTQQLRELEASGLVHRKVHAEVPPRVEYRLTELGESLRKVVLALRAWGESYLGQRAQKSPKLTAVR